MGRLSGIACGVVTQPSIRISLYHLTLIVIQFHPQAPHPTGQCLGRGGGGGGGARGAGVQTVEQLHPPAGSLYQQAKAMQGQQHSIPLQNSNSLDTQTDGHLPLNH